MRNSKSGMLPDGALVPTLELRGRLIGGIRRFAPDLVVTHRTCDYHPDHRATAQLVQDACYLLRVPAVEPSIKPLSADPVVLAMADFFTRPAPFRADVTLNIDSVFDDVVGLLDCHESQVYEWLPHVENLTVSGDRRRGWRRVLRAATHGNRQPIRTESRYAEAFEVSEYGRRMPADQISGRLGNPTHSA